MPSIGGWTLSDNFPSIAASATKRERFAQQCVELIVDYDFDGIDLGKSFDEAIAECDVCCCISQVRILF